MRPAQVATVAASLGIPGFPGGGVECLPFEHGSGHAGAHGILLRRVALLSTGLAPQLKLRMLVGGLVCELTAGLLPDVAYWCACDWIRQGDAATQIR